MYITIKQLRSLIKEAFREDFIWDEDYARRLIIDSMQEYAAIDSSEEINDFAADIASKLLSDDGSDGKESMWFNINARSDKAKRQLDTWRNISKNVMNLIDEMIADDTLTIFTKNYNDVEPRDSETRIKLSDSFPDRVTSDFNLDEAVKKSSHSKIFTAIQKNGTLDKIREATLALEHAKRLLSPVVKNKLSVLFHINIAHVDNYVDAKNWSAKYIDEIILIDDDKNKLFNDTIFSKFDKFDKFMIEIRVSLGTEVNRESFFNFSLHFEIAIPSTKFKKDREYESFNNDKFDRIVKLRNCKSYEDFPKSFKDSITYMIEKETLEPELDDFNLD